jgi:hypothetical protein
MKPRWNDTENGIQELGEKLFQCHSSTTNPTWTAPGKKPGFRGEKPATNRLSYCMAKTSLLSCNKAHKDIQLSQIEEILNCLWHKPQAMIMCISYTTSSSLYFIKCYFAQNISVN